ncbi:MAG: hypothetical protein AAGL49_00285, partial [Pseudomonadota bacterium]
GEYLSLPLKTYSSGMRLRLAFSVATAFEPDILILDEWLSAGDSRFRDKAEKRMEELVTSSGVFVLASHSPAMQKRLCNRGLVLRHGAIAFEGGMEEACEFYKTQMEDAAPGERAEPSAVRAAE